MKNKNEKQFGSKKEIALVNSVTALRFLGSFFVVPIFKALGGVAAAIFSGVFLFTDFIDGSLARNLKASTFFGALFDGATDKLFGIICLALLMTINPVVFSIPLLIEVGIIFAQNKKLQNGKNVKSNFIGKVKTWFLGLSIVGSFIAIDLLNMPDVINYMKHYSLDKVASIRDFLVLLGVQLPLFVTQALTFRSYYKEANEPTQEISQEQEEILEPEVLETSPETEMVENPASTLQAIAEEKQILQKKLTLLEKAKILGDAMFDPEYYAKNKDMPIRKLTKDLFNQN